MRLPILLSLSMLIMPVTVFSSDAPLSLTLNAAIRMAVEKNLDVRAELYNPAQFEADIHRNRSIYDPLFSIQSSYSDSTTSSITAVEAFEVYKIGFKDDFKLLDSTQGGISSYPRNIVINDKDLINYPSN